MPACDPPQKDIHKTAGGKVTDFFIYNVLGFAANAAVSIGITYGINPRPGVKRAKESVTNNIRKLFKDAAPERGINSAVEIGIMLIAGTVLTAAMAPLVTRRDRIAYWINQKLGRDTDVLPEHLRTHNAPLTLEDKIEQELKKRVKYGETSGDLWKGRWSAVMVPLFGDPLLSIWNNKREAKGKWSTDSLSWKAGQQLYDKALPKTLVHKLSSFFSSHGASIEEMHTNNPVIFNNLENYEKLHEERNQKILGKLPVSPAEREDRMMIADQTRLLGKEVAWTFVLAQIVEKLTCSFQKRRITKEENKALAKMREEGIIPVGIHAVTDDEGHVILTKTKGYAAPAPHGETPSVGAKVWSGEKSSGHVSTLDKNRASASSQQTSLT